MTHYGSMAQQNNNQGREVLEDILPKFKFDPSTTRVLEPFTLSEFESRVGNERESALHYTQRMFESYRRTFKRALDLSYKEVLQLEKEYDNNDLLRKNDSKNVSLSAPKILRKLHETGVINEVKKAVQENINSEEIMMALLAEVAMMSGGSVLVSKKGKPASDADKDYRNSLFGHTFVTMQPKAQIHFILSHFWGRFARIVADDKGILAGKDFAAKDTFWSVLSLGLSLQIAEGTADPEIVKKWITDRPNGVKWHMNRDTGQQNYADARQIAINRFIAGTSDVESKMRMQRVFENILIRSQKKFSAEGQPGESFYGADLQGFHVTYRGERVRDLHIKTTRNGQFIQFYIDSEEPRTDRTPCVVNLALRKNSAGGMMMHINKFVGDEQSVDLPFFVAHFVPSLAEAIKNVTGQSLVFSTTFDKGIVVAPFVMFLRRGFLVESSDDTTSVVYVT